MKKENLIFLDTETTGNDTLTDRLCQVCYKVHDKFYTEFFKPPVPISIKSMSITHITNKMVDDKESFIGSKIYKDLDGLLKENILVAHNAKFDIAILEAEGLKVPNSICTLRLARHLDKNDEIPEYNLQYLRYYYGLEIEGNAHDAEGDVKVLESLFDVFYKQFEEQLGGKDGVKKVEIKKEQTDLFSGVKKENGDDKIISEMIDISSRPSLLNKMPFGKYVGINLEELAKKDPNYLQWLLVQKEQDEDEDWIYSLKFWLKLK